MSVSGQITAQNTCSMSLQNGGNINAHWFLVNNWDFGSGFNLGSQTFAVPQTTVREVIEIEASAVRAVEHGEMAPYRGAAIPVFRLSSILGLPQPAGGRFHAFIVGTGAATVGLLADRILGQREIVVRPIADPLIRVEGVSGATDLGDGRAVLILDTSAIGRMARAGGTSSAARAQEIA